MLRSTVLILIKWKTSQNIKSFKILLAIFVSIFLGMGHGYLDGLRFEQRNTEFQNVKRGAVISLEQANTYSQVIPMVFTVPDAQGLLCGINENSSGLGARLLGVFGAPIIYNPYTLDNPFLYFSISEGFAGSMIVLYSLFALALTYQVASSDKKLNNIRLMLSFGISRNQYIFSEWISAVLAMVVPFIFGLLSFYISLIVVSAPAIVNSITLFAFIIFNFATVSFFALLGIWTSSSTSSSSISLTVTIIIWITSIWIIPSIAVEISKNIMPVNLDYQQELISEDDPNQKLILSLPVKPPSGIENWTLSSLPNKSALSDGQPNLTIKKRVELGKQYSLYKIIGQLSPILSVKAGLSSVSGTGGDGVLRFIAYCDKLNVSISNWHRQQLHDNPQRGLIVKNNDPPLIKEGINAYYEFFPIEGSSKMLIFNFLPILLMNCILVIGAMRSFNKKSLILSQ